PSDLIMMDINMPGMNGIQTTRRIRALPEFEAAAMTIVALTADVLGSERGHLSADFDGAILKPFDPQRWAGRSSRFARPGRERQRRKVALDASLALRRDQAAVVSSASTKPGHWRM
ncbi:MAG: response regulator, partial [Caulobacteraceae bacterium]